MYVIQVENRAELQKHLSDERLGTGIHYPVPLHLQNAYKHLGYGEGAFPVPEAAAPKLLSLPMFPQITAAQHQRVSDAVFRFTSEATAEKERKYFVAAGSNVAL